MNTFVTLQDLIKLSEEFGLPCIVRNKEITIIGEKTVLVFKYKQEEKNQCQLIHQHI